MNSKQIRAFLFAGRATFTVTSHSGRHYTYRLSGGGDKPIFAYVMTGGADAYTYMGIARPGRLIATKASKLSKESPAWQGLEWLLRWADSDASWPEDKAKFQHAGKCGRCGRELTDPESIERGLGPICAEISL